MAEEWGPSDCPRCADLLWLRDELCPACESEIASSDPASPFPAEPAFGSPEAVDQAAETIRGFTPEHLCCEICGEESPAGTGDWAAVEGGEHHVHRGACWIAFDLDQRLVLDADRDRVKKLVSMLVGHKAHLLADRDRLRRENDELRRQEGELLAEAERLREDRERFRQVSEQVCYELKGTTEQRDALAEALLLNRDPRDHLGACPSGRVGGEGCSRLCRASVAALKLAGRLP